MPAEAKTSHTPAFVARYNALIAGIELVNIRLANAEVSAITIYVKDSGRKLEANIANEAEYFNIDSGFVVRSRLAFEGRYADDEAAQVSVSLGLELVYLSPAPLTDDLFDAFKQRNLPLNTWPYFRELLQSMLLRAGWPVYTLPAYKLHERSDVTEIMDPPSIPQLPAALSQE